MPLVRNCLPSTLLLLVLALAILGLLAFFGWTKGPYWLAGNLDPDYAYLTNALNLARGQPPFHTDHPGTFVQELGAAVLLASHALIGHGQLADDVLRRPELYLTLINGVFLLSCAVFALLAGVATRAALGLVPALFVVLTPLLSSTLTWNCLSVKPEPVIIGLCLGVVAVIMRRLNRRFGSRDFPDAVFFGLLIGFAIGSKITALPLLLVPVFLFRHWRPRALFSLATLASVILALIPAFRRLPSFGELIRRIATHSGRYGLGAPSLFDGAAYAGAVLDLLTGNATFFAAILFGGVALLKTSPCMNMSSSDFPDSVRRSLRALLVCQIVSVLFVARHPWDYRYLAPALGLIGAVLALSLAALTDRPLARLSKATLIASAFLLLLGLYQAAQLKSLFRRLTGIRVAHEAVNREVAARFPAASISYYYGASSPAFALHFGDWWAGSLYGREVQALFPHTRYYNISHRCFEEYPGYQPPRISGSPSIDLLQGMPLSESQLAQVPVPTPPVLVFSNGAEAVYLLQPGRPSSR